MKRILVVLLLILATVCPPEKSSEVVLCAFIGNGLRARINQLSTYDGTYGPIKPNKHH